MTELTQMLAFSGKTEERLTDRQLVDYRNHRERYVKWLLTFGKDPDRVEGYAESTARNHAARTDRFYRWVWDYEGQYTLELTHEHADERLTELAYENWTDAHRAKCYQALVALYDWLEETRGLAPWEPVMSFYERGGTTQPRDFLTREERTAVREAALEYGSIPSYGDLSPEARDRWKAYLAQRFEKPKDEVRPADWDRANGWKIPSLVATSLDCGLRPIEVERARPGWIDVGNRLLRIPAAESAKNTDNWTVSLQDRTAVFLDRWLDQRAGYAAYDDTDRLWLTQRGNPYQSASLSYLLERLFEIAELPTAGRQLSWYTIRHSVGTYMAREEGLAAAQQQLRHQDPETTMKYDQAPVEDRRDALSRMG